VSGRVHLVWTDVSEEYFTSICRVAHSPFDWWLSLKPPAHASSSPADFSTLKMEAIRSSETSVHTRLIRRHISDDGILLTVAIFMFNDFGRDFGNFYIAPSLGNAMNAKRWLDGQMSGKWLENFCEHVVTWRFWDITPCNPIYPRWRNSL
jgi:hypothetical protein